MKVFRVRSSDSQDLFNWRNDEMSIAMSLNTNRISEDEHNTWFEAAIDSNDKIIYVASEEGFDELVGMVRFELEGSFNSRENNKEKNYLFDPIFADISIIVNPNFRGRRLATPLLLSAIKEFRRSYNIPITAHIKEENKASIKCFEKANFVLMDRYEKSFFYLMKMPITEYYPHEDF